MKTWTSLCVCALGVAHHSTVVLQKSNCTLTGCNCASTPVQTRRYSRYSWRSFAVRTRRHQLGGSQCAAHCRASELRAAGPQCSLAAGSAWVDETITTSSCLKHR